MASSKKCFIAARYLIKASGAVCCVVENEKGTRYQTTIQADGHACCSCPARLECYHIRHVRAAEAARGFRKQIHIDCLIADINAAFGYDVIQRGCTPVVQKAAAKREPLQGIGARGTLTNNQGFSLLRKSA